jgi:tetratricopeptide (TPR) repeat protein
MASEPEALTPQQQRAQYKTMAGVNDLRAGERKAARTKLEEALDLDHESVDARLWLAHVLLEEGDSAAAARQYRAGLMFHPGEQRLLEGLRAAESAAVRAATPEGRDETAVKQRLVPNLIMAALMPPGGFLLGLWEIITGRTQEWKDLGVKTLLASIAAAAAWVLILTFISLIVEGGAGPSVTGP